MSGMHARGEEQFEQRGTCCTSERPSTLFLKGVNTSLRGACHVWAVCVRGKEVLAISYTVRVHAVHAYSKLRDKRHTVCPRCQR